MNSVQDDHAKVLGNTSEYRSNPIMTKYEFNQLVALRTLHLSKGAPPFVPIPDDLTIESNMELRKIAEQELIENKLPYIVKRVMPNGKIEYWKVDNLNICAVRNLFRHHIGGVVRV